MNRSSASWNLRSPGSAFQMEALASVTTCCHRQCLEAIRVQPRAAGLRQPGKYSSPGFVLSHSGHAYSPLVPPPTHLRPVRGGEGTFGYLLLSHRQKEQQESMFCRPFLKRASIFPGPSDTLLQTAAAHSRAAHLLKLFAVGAGGRTA